MPLATLLERTNSRLAIARHEYRQLQEYSHEFPEGMVDPDDEAPLRSALSRLIAVDDGSDVARHHRQQLLDWHLLSPPGRKALIREILSFVERQKESHRVTAFVQVLARRFPHQWEPIIVLLVTATALALALPIAFLAGHNSPMTPLIVLIMAAVGGFAGSWPLQRVVYKWWFRKHVVVPAQEMRIDAGLIWRVLSNRKSVRAIGAKKMAMKLDILKQLLPEQVASSDGK